MGRIIRDGHISAFSYKMLDQADFDPSDGITLQFAKSTVHIIGRNLNVEARPHLRLFEGITRRRVTWIQVADEPTVMEAPAGATVIDDVEVSRPQLTVSRSVACMDHSARRSRQLRICARSCQNWRPF
jgi:hypothetical protein